MKRLLSLVLVVVLLAGMGMVNASAETDEQTNARIAVAKTAMEEALAAFDDFPKPYPNPTGPMRLLSQLAQNRYNSLYDEISNWSNGAYQYAKNNVDDLTDLYEQTAEKWRLALETVKSLGYVDTTQAEVYTANRIAECVRYLLNQDWLRAGNVQKGTLIPTGYMQWEVYSRVPYDDCELVILFQSGQLEAKVQEAKEKVLEIMATFLTEQGMQDVLDCDMYCSKWVMFALLLDEAEPESKLHLVEQIVNGSSLPELTESQKKALDALNAEISILAKYFISGKPESFRFMADYCRILLWYSSEAAKIIGIDLTPYIGVITKPVIPKETKSFSQFWSSFLQWVLKYLFFGWLWMRWT